MSFKETLSRKARSARIGVPVVAVVAAGLALVSCSRDIGKTNLVDCENGPKSNSVTLFLASQQSIQIGPGLITATTDPGEIEVRDPVNITNVSLIKVTPEGKITIKNFNGDEVYEISGKPISNQELYT